MRAQIDGTDSQINDKFYVRASGGGQLSASKLEEVVKTLEFVLSSKGSSQGSSLGQRPKFSKTGSDTMPTTRLHTLMGASVLLRG